MACYCLAVFSFLNHRSGAMLVLPGHSTKGLALSHTSCRPCLETKRERHREPRRRVLTAVATPLAPLSFRDDVQARHVPHRPAFRRPDSVEEVRSNINRGSTRPDACSSVCSAGDFCRPERRTAVKASRRPLNALHSQIKLVLSHMSPQAGTAIARTRFRRGLASYSAAVTRKFALHRLALLLASAQL